MLGGMGTFEDGSGNDAWYMYMTESRLAVKRTEITLSAILVVVAVHGVTRLCRRMHSTSDLLNLTRL